MNSDLLESIRISTKKYQSLIDKQSSSLAAAKALRRSAVMRTRESVLSAFDGGRIWNSYYNHLDDAVKNYEAALGSIINVKSDLLSVSEQFSKTLAAVTEPVSMRNISALGYVDKMFVLGDTLKTHESLLRRIDIQSILNSHFDTNIQTKISDLLSVSNGDLVSKMIESMQHQPVAVLNTDYVPSQIEIAQATEILYEENDQKSFLEQFYRLSPFLQALVLYIIMSFLIPITNNIAANLLTPIVQEYITDKFKNDTDKIRNIKAAPSKIIHTKVDTSHLRFITAKRGLNVRSLPSIQKSSTIKSTASFGTIVEVLDKRKNWIKISYKVDGETVKGWVFTRYTKRFKK